MTTIEKLDEGGDPLTECDLVVLGICSLTEIMRPQATLEFSRRYPMSALSLLARR
jgi:hypothetical protein